MPDRIDHDHDDHEPDAGELAHEQASRHPEFFSRLMGALGQQVKAPTLVDHLNALVVALALGHLVDDLEGYPDDLDPSEILAPYGLTRVRVSWLLSSALSSAAIAWVSTDSAELDAIAVKFGYRDAATLARWVQGVAADQDGEPSDGGPVGELARRLDRIRACAALVDTLAGYRECDDPHRDQFAARNLSREGLGAWLRSECEGVRADFGGDQALASLEFLQPPSSAPTPPRGQLYLVRAIHEHEHEPDQRPANEGPAEQLLGPALECAPVGAVVESLRTARGLSRADLGRATGLSVSTIRGIELGRDPKLKSTQAIAAAFGLSLVEFAGMIAAGGQ